MVKIINIGNGISPPQTSEQIEATKRAIEFEAKMILQQARRGEWNPEEQTLALFQGSHDVRAVDSKAGSYKDGTVFYNGEVIIEIDKTLVRRL